MHGNQDLLQTLMLGLVDRYHLLLFPVVLGSGKRSATWSARVAPQRLARGRGERDGQAREASRRRRRRPLAAHEVAVHRLGLGVASVQPYEALDCLLMARAYSRSLSTVNTSKCADIFSGSICPSTMHTLLFNHVTAVLGREEGHEKLPADCGPLLLQEDSAAGQVDEDFGAVGGGDDSVRVREHRARAPP